ncbi:MAG: hypothetical protein C0498_11410 [Anaerolinea sp.]|nr:hypothetical protein [Anaerolinea sp.]
MRRRWLQGFAVGCVSGAAVVLAGPLALVPAGITWWWALRGPSKLAAGSGGFMGAGAGLLVLVGPAAIRCTLDPSCAQPTLFSWVGVGVGLLILGIGIGMAAPPRTGEPP